MKDKELFTLRFSATGSGYAVLAKSNFIFFSLRLRFVVLIWIGGMNSLEDLFFFLSIGLGISTFKCVMLGSLWK